MYYLQIRPDVVKIGTTRYLLDRIRALGCTIGDLLATEPGGRGLERLRHEQFGVTRIAPNRADFTVTGPLREHMIRLREQHETVLTRSHIRTAPVVIPRRVPGRLDAGRLGTVSTDPQVAPHPAGGDDGTFPAA